MPVLPLIDLMIMIGWTSLIASGVLKAIYAATTYRPQVLGLGPLDFVVIAGVCLLFALTLAARTWVKYHEPRLFAARRQARHGGLEEERQPAGVTPLHGPGHVAADRS